MKKWKYIIFDMDGTLFDTEQISLKAWMHIKDIYGYPVTEDFDYTRSILFFNLQDNKGSDANIDINEIKGIRR